MRKLIYRISLFLCLSGGFSLILLVLLTIVNIAGRNLIFMGITPIPGYLEIMKLLLGFSGFSFLPWCAIKKKHVTIDVIYAYLPKIFKKALNFFSATLMLAISLLILFQLIKGMQDLKEYQEVSFILQIPLWWGYAVALPGALGLVMVSGYQFFTSWEKSFRV